MKIWSGFHWAWEFEELLDQIIIINSVILIHIDKEEENDQKQLFWSRNWRKHERVFTYFITALITNANMILVLILTNDILSIPIVYFVSLILI